MVLTFFFGTFPSHTEQLDTYDDVGDERFELRRFFTHTYMHASIHTHAQTHARAHRTT